MDCNTVKCYCSDRDSHPCPEGHPPRALTTSVNCPPLSRLVDRCRETQLKLVARLRRQGFYVSFKKVATLDHVTKFLGIHVIYSVVTELRLLGSKLEDSSVRRSGKRGVLAHRCKVVGGVRRFIILSPQQRRHPTT